MKRLLNLLFTCILLCIITLPLQGQITYNKTHNNPIQLLFEARADYRNRNIDGIKDSLNSGFKGDIIDFYLKGDISSKFSYQYRQRLNKNLANFNATDWLFLDYIPNDNFTFRFGKWAVLVGTWDLEPAPIDCYDLYDFCYGFPCYQWGIVGNYKTNTKKDSFYAQICASPFKQGGFAYNLMWFGSHGIFHTDWSVNLLELPNNKYINYIALGTRITPSPKWVLDFDIMNRYAPGQTYWFKDYTVATRWQFAASNYTNVFIKASYDINKTGTPADTALPTGTEVTKLGCGLEFFLLKNKNIRIHTVYTHCFGNYPIQNAIFHKYMNLFDIGLTWRIRII